MKRQSNTIRKAAEIASQFQALLKHFTVRLLNNDMVSYDDSHQEGLFVFLAFLAMSGGLLSVFLMIPYLAVFPGYTHDTVWIEKTLFFSFSMALTGLITILNWENIFLDKKDYDCLFALPVSKTVIFAAKGASTLLFTGIVTVAFNLIPSLVFPLFLGHVPANFTFHSANMFRYIFVHMLSCFFANLMVFLTLSFLQTLLILIFRGNAYRRISLMVQTALIFGFVSVFVWFPKIHPALGVMRETYDPFIYRYPPLWFVGFSEFLMSNYDYVFRYHTRLAAIILVVLLNMYLISFPINFRRYTWVSGTNRETRPTFLSRLWEKGLHAAVLRHPEERGIFHFTIAILRRSRYHKLFLSFFITIPTAIFAGSFIHGILRHGFGFYRVPRFVTVALPLIIVLALIAGLRGAVARPASPEAAWLFKVHAFRYSLRYSSGFHKALFVAMILPAFTVFLAFQIILWGAVPAILHSMYTLGVALILFQLFFFNYRAIPFISEYLPGRLNLKATWLPLLITLIIYISFTSRLGLFLLGHPSGYLYFAAIVVISLFILRRFRLRGPRESHPWLGSQEPESAFMSLGWDPHS